MVLLGWAWALKLTAEGGGWACGGGGGAIGCWALAFFCWLRDGRAFFSGVVEVVLEGNQEFFCWYVGCAGLWEWCFWLWWAGLSLL